MSLKANILKAKLEAVIYASEEPVTLAQLIGLLGEEGQAELDAIAAQQQSLALEAESANASDDEEDLLNAEVLEPAEVVEAQTPPAEADAAATEASAIDEKKLVRERDRKLRDYFRSLLDQLIADYADSTRGLEIREVAGGFRLATKPEYHDTVRGFVKSLKPPLRLTLQALETLAVVAYKQPVTAPEVSEIRGVDSSGILGSLLTRKLITTAGRKQVIGRPILYKTTRDFLLRFGLKDINELPSIEEFEKMAGELNNAVQEEIPMDTPDAPDGRSDEALYGTSALVDEANAAPEPTYTSHDTPEDLMSDKSAYLEGHNREHEDPAEVEPMADVHSDQADGTPEDEVDA
jgi:segregation and condensation protein B